MTIVIMAREKLFLQCIPRYYYILFLHPDTNDELHFVEDGSDSQKLNGLSYSWGLVNGGTRGTKPHFISIQSSFKYRICWPSIVKYLRKSKLHPPLDFFLRCILPFSLLDSKQK